MPLDNQGGPVGTAGPALRAARSKRRNARCSESFGVPGGSERCVSSLSFISLSGTLDGSGRCVSSLSLYFTARLRLLPQGHYEKATQDVMTGVVSGRFDTDSKGLLALVADWGSMARRFKFYEQQDFIDQLHLDLSSFDGTGLTTKSLVKYTCQQLELPLPRKASTQAEVFAKAEAKMLKLERETKSGSTPAPKPTTGPASATVCHGGRRNCTAVKAADCTHYCGTYASCHRPQCVQRKKEVDASKTRAAGAADTEDRPNDGKRARFGR